MALAVVEKQAIDLVNTVVRHLVSARGRTLSTLYGFAVVVFSERS